MGKLMLSQMLLIICHLREAFLVKAMVCLIALRLNITNGHASSARKRDLLRDSLHLRKPSKSSRDIMAHSEPGYAQPCETPKFSGSLSL